MDPTAKAKASDEEASKKYMEKLEQILADDSEEDCSDIECEPCEKIFSTVLMFEQHLNSKKHHKTIAKLRSRQKLAGDAAPKKKSTNEQDDSEDSSEEIYCDVCDKEMSGYKNYMAHMKGSIHAKNLKQLKLKEKVKGLKEFENDVLDEDVDDTLQKPFARCSSCCKTFYGPESYQQHLKGANHKKKLRQLKIIESLTKKEEGAENGTELDDTFSKCEVCEKSFSGPVPYKVHLMSAVHQKELLRVKTENELKDLFEKDEDDDKLVCKECKKAFSDPFSFKSHIANNSHGKQKVKDTMFGFVAANPDIVAVKSVQSVGSDDEEETEEKENEFKNGRYFLVCKLCHMSFSGPESAKDHLKSKNHSKTKFEKAQKKALKDKLKDKQNGRPLGIDQETSASVGPENGQKRSSNDQEKNNQTVSSKPKDTSEIQEDFEMI